MSEFRQPTMQCPQCSAEYEDLDGLSVLHCERCGYCKHASVTRKNGDWICDYCGKDISVKTILTIAYNTIIIASGYL